MRPSFEWIPPGEHQTVVFAFSTGKQALHSIQKFTAHQYLWFSYTSTKYLKGSLMFTQSLPSMLGGASYGGGGLVKVSFIIVTLHVKFVAHVDRCAGILSIGSHT